MKIPKNKKCTKCGQVKSAKEFYKRKSTKDGLRHDCIKCVHQYAVDHKKQHNEWKIINRGEIQKYQKEYDKKYRKLNQYKIKRYKKAWYQKNAKIVKDHSEILKNREDDKIPYPKKQKCRKCGKIKSAAQYSKLRIRVNGLSSRCKKCDKKYRIDHREKIKIINKISNKNRRDRINKYRRERRKIDVKFKILSNLRTRLHHALRLQNAKKYSHTVDLISCSIEFLKKYLEAKFSSGMSWDNYGLKGWHIDHIRPCASFELIKPEEQKKCFHYINLAPMWENDNFRKNSFYNGRKI